MKFYRIKQTDDNKFIPQVSNDIVNWLFNFWDGIETSDNEFTTWYSDEYQEQFCTTDSLESAKEVIGKYQETFKLQKEYSKYPKYHKL